MKTPVLFFALISLFCLRANAQLNQLYDNTNYKALYLTDVAKLINTTPNLFILDVRSPGEYADTSKSVTLNIGRLKGSVNIFIDSIEKHLKDLEPYKNKPVLVYCSHSQRSRVVSKFLGDHGFTNVYSLNGGMSLVNKSTNQEFPVKPKLYTSNLPYKLIESEDAYKFIKDKNHLVIDVRPASQFNGTDAAEENNIGRIKNAVNIPLASIEQKMGELAKYKNKPILFYGLTGSDGVDAGKKFANSGFKNVYVLFEGLTTLMVNTPSGSALRTELFAVPPKYKVIGSKETIALVNSQPGLVLLDVRPVAEFENKSSQKFFNLGRIKNAITLPTEPQLYAYLKSTPKSAPILVYGSGMSGMSGMGTMPAILAPGKVCRDLSAKGYTNVHLLYSGLYSLIWSVTNVEDCKNGMSILADHKGLY